jgi:hypothetical protein
MRIILSHVQYVRVIPPVGIFYRKSVLVIDGKNNNVDGK